jgi:hypothetical protein
MGKFHVRHTAHACRDTHLRVHQRIVIKLGVRLPLIVELLELGVVIAGDTRFVVLVFEPGQVVPVLAVPQLFVYIQLAEHFIGKEFRGVLEIRMCVLGNAFCPIFVLVIVSYIKS